MSALLGSIKINLVVQMNKTGAGELLQFCHSSIFAKRCENIPTAYSGLLSNSSKISHCRCCKINVKLLSSTRFVTGSMLVLLVVQVVPLVSTSVSVPQEAKMVLL